MAPLRFICFLLVLVLVYVRDSTAQTHQDMKKSVAAHGRELEAAGRSSTNVEKDDGVPGVAVLGGRKRMLKRGLAKEEVLNREDSISGAAHSVGNCNRRRKGILNVECKLRKRGKDYALNMNSELLQNQQDERSVVKAKLLNSASLENSWMKSVDLTSTSRLAGSPENSEKRELQDSGDTLRNVQSQKLLDAADDEIVKLMSKDYQGHTPSRPPIHNNQPLNEEHVIP
ncbi:hypothetical protein Pint_16318 [Pistacia integerrima]|uniref:Uncharacterized protein n=1 Tax=Pistacia integerrima TaxID=434235 RepID=A0ACC0Z8S1_9ROSI|nr:hypothetical protein Pint_16318 [Pistacia integerrima]